MCILLPINISTILIFFSRGQDSNTDVQVTVRGPLHIVRAPRRGHITGGDQVEETISSEYFHQYRYYQEAFDDEDEDEEEDEEEKRQSANHSSRILVEVPVEVMATI